MTTLQTHLEDMAAALRGNWKRFPSFAWHYEYVCCDPENWCIVYTHNRDSGLLEESNATAIARILKPHLDGDDIITEDHNHWACGWVAGYSIRVYQSDGVSVTPAMKAWCEIQIQLDNYPVLNEEDYSRLEFEATLDNIESEGKNLVKSEYQGDWVSSVYDWFSANNYRELESQDDCGAYPSEEAIAEALYDLDLLDEDYLHLVED